MTPRIYSLRRRLIATTLGSSVLVALVGTAIVITVAWQETSDVFDDALKEGARMTLSLGVGLAASGGLDGGASVLRARERTQLFYQIIDKEGRVVRRADGAPRQPFVDATSAGDRFHDTWADGEAWRVYVLRNQEPAFSVQVAQEWDERTELLTDTIEALAWPLLALWSTLAVFGWWMIRRLLAPLEALAGDIRDRSLENLSPLPTEGQAREILPILASLNGLLDRLRRALDSERRFTADAAHELRTPLAALGSRLQLMARVHGPGGSPALLADLDQVRDDVRRSTALVGNLLELARLEPEGGTALSKSEFDLKPLLDLAARSCAADAQKKDIEITIDCSAGRVCAQHDLLLSAVRNLVDNAIRHGHSGGRVVLTAARARCRAAGAWQQVATGGAAVGSPDHHRDGVAITVADDGPGVDEADYARLTQRFFRILGGSDQGSGLGLSIVARIGALHQGALAFGPGLGGRGLAVRLWLP